MNLFELACAAGQHKIVQYFLKDLRLIHKRDLNQYNDKMIHETVFLYVPVLKKDI